MICSLKKKINKNKKINNALREKKAWEKR